MNKTRPFQNAFSSGEIDPLLHARSDFQRYQTGMAACRGFLPLRQGGFTRAPGTIWRGSTRDDAPAIRVPFEFSAEDALALEFTDQVMRVWRYGALVTSGGAPYELVTPYTETDLPRMQWVQDKDVIYLVDGRQPMQKLSRLALDNWAIAPVDLTRGPFRVQNLDEAMTIQCNGATGVITLTATGGPFAANWVGSLLRLEPTDFSNVPLWVGNASLSVGDMVYYGDHIYRLAAGTNSGVNPPVHDKGTRRTDASKPTQWEHVSGLVGIVRITAVANANEATAEVISAIPQPCIDDPTYRWSEGAWSARYGYPALLEMHDQSLWAAATPEEPRTIWKSAQGLFEDFGPSAEADGAFAYTIAATQTQNAIQWLRRGRNGIYIGALGEVYRGFSSSAGEPIGPLTFDTELVSQDGASQARPISAYGYPIYITKGGLRLQELRYSFEEDGARPVELSLPSQHLGAGLFLQVEWQSSPQRLAWLRRADGTLAPMNYDPDQDVLGWAVIPVAGGVVEYIDVTSGPDGSTDIVTLIVRRSVGGVTRRFVEEQALIWGVLTGVRPIEEAVHLFAASVQTADPARTGFSLPHLAGETVYAWTNEGEYGPLTVAPDGAVTLPVAVSHAVIGLFDPTHYAETLDIEAPAPDGGTRGRRRRLHGAVGIDLHKTAAGEVAAVEHHFGQPEIEAGRHELVPRQIAANLTTVHSGTSRVHPVSGHADSVRLRFWPVGGAPMTVQGVTPNIEEGGP